MSLTPYLTSSTRIPSSKRCFDLFFSAIGLILLSPVFAFCAIAILADSPGPVLFRQERAGRDGKRFRILKFRTMRVNSEAAGQLTVGRDSRITRTGRLLRKWKLDELPQLWNVLVGEMSFVGPRPEVPRYVALYKTEHRETLETRPGITDLASIEFLDENDLLGGASDPERLYIEKIMPLKLRLHQEYLRRASFAFDLLILFRTVYKIVSPKCRAVDLALLAEES